jgi:hypothetical protein
VRRCLLNGSAGSDALTRLLPAPQGERRRRHQPIGQDREGLVARMTDSTPYTNTFVPVVVGLAESPSVANDRVSPANRTLPRQEVQGDHPGSLLSFSSGSAIKRITAGVKARRDRSLLKSRSAAGPSPSGNVSFERKKNTALRGRPPASHSNIGRLSPTIRKSNRCSILSRRLSRSRRASCLRRALPPARA